MSRRSDCYSSNSGQYVDYLQFTSSSAIRMPSSSGVPQTHGASVPVQRIELQPLVVEERPCDQPAAGDHD